MAEEDGDVKGFFLFKIEDRDKCFKIKQVGYLELLFVKESARGRGVSKQLMEKAREVLKERNIRYLKLSVHMDNPAWEVWKKQGFKEYRVDMYKEI